MKIIQIVKKDSSNAEIYFDGGIKFVVSMEVIFNNGLRKDDEISEDQFFLLEYENQKYLIKKNALRFLARRHHSVFELKTKLKLKKFSSKVIEEVIAELVKLNLLNDYEFGILYSNERINLKKYGANKIKSDLIKKGLDHSTIKKIIEELGIEENIESAKQIAEKKLSNLKKRGVDKSKLKQKLFAFLLSKGYEYDISSQIVSQLINNKKFS